MIFPIWSCFGLEARQSHQGNHRHERDHGPDIVSPQADRCSDRARGPQTRGSRRAFDRNHPAWAAGGRSQVAGLEALGLLGRGAQFCAS